MIWPPKLTLAASTVIVPWRTWSCRIRSLSSGSSPALCNLFLPSSRFLCLSMKVFVSLCSVVVKAKTRSQMSDLPFWHARVHELTDAVRAACRCDEALRYAVTIKHQSRPLWMLSFGEVAGQRHRGSWTSSCSSRNSSSAGFHSVNHIYIWKIIILSPSRAHVGISTTWPVSWEKKCLEVCWPMFALLSGDICKWYDTTYNITPSTCTSVKMLTSSLKTGLMHALDFIPEK